MSLVDISPLARFFGQERSKPLIVDFNALRQVPSINNGDDRTRVTFHIPWNVDETLCDPVGFVSEHAGILSRGMNECLKDGQVYTAIFSANGNVDAKLIYDKKNNRIKIKTNFHDGQRTSEWKSVAKKKRRSKVGKLLAKIETTANNTKRLSHYLRDIHTQAA